MTSGFIKLNRDLLHHPCVESAPLAQRWVLITILDRMAWESTEQDDHGYLVKIEKNQLMCSHRQLAKWAGVSLNDVQRAIARYHRLEILSQKVSHKKSILTIVWKSYLEQSESTSDVNVSQSRVIKEEVKKEKKIKNKKLDSPIGSELSSFLLESIKRNCEDFKIPNIESWILEFDRMVRLDNRDPEMIKLAINWGVNNSFWKGVLLSAKAIRKHFDKLIIQSKEEKVNKPKKLSNKDFIKSIFVHRNIYNGTTCYISEEEVAFERGMKHRRLNYKTAGFKEELERILQEFSIEEVANWNQT